MEYCGAGSVLDIMKLRGIHHGLPKGIVKSLTEEEIATVLCDTLKGNFTQNISYYQTQELFPRTKKLRWRGVGIALWLVR